MNLDASAVAPEFQWLWIMVGLAALGTGGLVGAIGGKQKAMVSIGIQGTLLSLVLLSVAPTGAEQQQAAIDRQHAAAEQLTDYAELLGALLVS